MIAMHGQDGENGPADTWEAGGAVKGGAKLLPPHAAQQQSGQNQSSSSAGACCSAPRHSRWYVAGHRSQHSRSPCSGQRGRHDVQAGLSWAQLTSAASVRPSAAIMWPGNWHQLSPWSLDPLASDRYLCNPYVALWASRQAHPEAADAAAVVVLVVQQRRRRRCAFWRRQAQAECQGRRPCRRRP